MLYAEYFLFQNQGETPHGGWTKTSDMRPILSRGNGFARSGEGFVSLAFWLGAEADTDPDKGWD